MGCPICSGQYKLLNCLLRSGCSKTSPVPATLSVATFAVVALGSVVVPVAVAAQVAVAEAASFVDRRGFAPVDSHSSVGGLAVAWLTPSGW